MDKQKIKDLAVSFENIAERYALKSEEAKNLLNAMRPLIIDAKAEKISHLVDYIPGRCWFTEGGLSQYSDLESAYAEFKLVLAFGEDNDEVNETLDSIKKMQEQLFNKG